MKLYTNCKSCKAAINIASGAETRPDLQMEKGSEFKVNCTNCGKFDKKHVNDISASPNKTMLLTGIILGIFATIVLWFFYGAIGAASLTIPFLFWQQQVKATHAFNSYMIRRK